MTVSIGAAMFKYLISLLLNLITTLVESITKPWATLAIGATPKVKDAILIVLTIALLLELFWFTTFVTFWFFWYMLSGNM